MSEIDFTIIKEIGVLSSASKGWELQLNIVKWGNNAPKYDLRTWAPGRSKAGKGITFTEEEAIKLMDLLHSDIFED